MKEDIGFLEEEGRLTVYINCDIDHHAARRMRERIDDRLVSLRPRRLVIDFSRVGFMDSSGLGLVLGRVEKARLYDTKVEIRGLSPTLMRLVRLSGMDRVQNLTITK